jgi:hypothetical protein
MKVRRPSLADIARYPIADTEISPDVARKMVARFGAIAHLPRPPPRVRGWRRRNDHLQSVP